MSGGVSRSTKSHVLATITEVFREHGYSATTLSKLTEATGLQKASLYHYFPKGKNEMALVVLDSILEQLQDKILNCLNEKVSPKKRLFRMLKAIGEFYKGGQLLCFITVFSIGDLDKNCRKNLKLAVEKWIKLLAKTLEEAKLPKSENKAYAVLATLQGSLILARTLNDPDIFLMCLDQLSDDWNLT